MNQEYPEAELRSLLKKAIDRIDRVLEDPEPLCSQDFEELEILLAVCREVRELLFPATTVLWQPWPGMPEGGQGGGFILS